MGDARRQIEIWHRQMAAMTGSMSLSLERGTINKSDVERWSRKLKDISVEMKNFAEGAEKVK
jgi:hypothetical protein